MTEIPLELPPCRFGVRGQDHRAELVPGTDRTYLYASHAGAWQATCAEHSGLCHDRCWPERAYPQLRPRIAEKAAT